MNFKSINYSKLLFILVFLFIAGETLYERLIQNSYPLFWLDEPIELIIAIHTPFTKIFFTALNEIISSMPLFYMEYWLYLQWLYHIFPLNELMRNMEFYLRLPLTVYAVITIVSITTMTWRLSRSYVFAGITTLLLFTINYLSNHLGSELRFHSAGFAHAALSWACFTLFLTSENNSNRFRYVYFILWMLTGILAGASHIYSTYSLFIQLLVFLLVWINWLPGFSFSKINLPAKFFGFLIVFLSAIAEGLFFIFWSKKPYPRDAILGNLDAIDQGINLLSSTIFIPHLGIWLGLFCLFAFVTFKRTETIKDQLKIIFLFILGCIQIILIAYLSWKYLKWTWGPNMWMPRYVIAGLIPFVFFLSYFARGCIKLKWENKIAVGVAFIAIGIFLLNPTKNDSYWGNHQTHYGDERWIKLRQDLLAINGYGRVNYVLGLKPSIDPFTQFDIHDQPVDFYWQLYSGGPFSLTHLDNINTFGGKKSLPCKIRHVLGEAIIEAESYALDFCDKDKVTLRIVQ